MSGADIVAAIAPSARTSRSVGRACTLYGPGWRVAAREMTIPASRITARCLLESLMLAELTLAHVTQLERTRPRASASCRDRRTPSTASAKLKTSPPKAGESTPRLPKEPGPPARRLRTPASLPGDTRA
jgi:hypothetical protein